MLTKHIQDLIRIATLFAARIEFAIRIGTSPTLAKTVIALRIYLLRLGDVRKIFLTVVYILAPFQHDGPQTQFYQSQRSEKSARTCSHHNNLWLTLYVRIVCLDIFIIMRQFVHIYPHLQVDEYLPLSGVDTALQDAHTGDGPHIKAVFIGQTGF